MKDAPPPYERLVLGFGAAIAAVSYLYWTSVGMDRGDGWTSLPASRALFALGAAVILALVLRLAVRLNSKR